jgi:hypothetical protein
MAVITRVKFRSLEEIDRSDMQGADADGVLRLCRENSGLAVATMRLWVEQRREIRKPANQTSLFGGARNSDMAAPREGGYHVRYSASPS